jgi:hypothetical protein
VTDITINISVSTYYKSYHVTKNRQVERIIYFVKVINYLQCMNTSTSTNISNPQLDHVVGRFESVSTYYKSYHSTKNTQVERIIYFVKLIAMQSHAWTQVQVQTYLIHNQIMVLEDLKPGGRNNITNLWIDIVCYNIDVKYHEQKRKLM